MSCSCFFQFYGSQETAGFKASCFSYRSAVLSECLILPFTLVQTRSHPIATEVCKLAAVYTAGRGMCKVVARRGLVALSARVADGSTGSESKMMFPHPKGSCCLVAHACSKKVTFESSGNSASVFICWTEAFRD